MEDKEKIEGFWFPIKLCLFAAVIFLFFIILLIPIRNYIIDMTLIDMENCLNSYNGEIKFEWCEFEEQDCGFYCELPNNSKMYLGYNINRSIKNCNKLLQEVKE